MAAKAALAGITRSLAAELGGDGITCNAIAPGYFETDLTVPQLANAEFVAYVNSRVALRRWGKPRDLAVLACCSPRRPGPISRGRRSRWTGG